MHLTDEQITEFQLLYKEQFGKDISREEAYDQAMKLITLVKIVYKQMTEDALKELSEKR